MEVYKVVKPNGDIFGYIVKRKMLITNEPIEADQYLHIVLPEEKNRFMRTKIISKEMNGVFFTHLDDEKEEEFLVKLTKRKYLIIEINDKQLVHDVPVASTAIVSV